MKTRILIAAAVMIGAAGCETVELPGSPEELINLGWSDYRLSEFDNAIFAFHQAALHAPKNSDTHLHALYSRASVHNLRRPRENRTLARQLYQEVAERNPDSPWAAWSMLALARMDHNPPIGQEPNLETLRASYQRIMDRFPDHPAAHEAALFQALTYLRSQREADARQAEELLWAFLEAHPDSDYESLAYFLLFEAARILRDPEAQILATIRRLETLPEDPYGVAVSSQDYWRVASMAEFELGDLDLAREHYQKLLDEHPTDLLAFASEQALKRLDEVEREARERVLRERQAQAGREEMP